MLLHTLFSFFHNQKVDSGTTCWAVRATATGSVCERKRGKARQSRKLVLLASSLSQAKHLWCEVWLWRPWTRLSDAARVGSKRWDVQARGVAHTGELKHTSLMLFLVSSLTANEIIRIHVYIVIIYTFPQLGGVDLTCFFSTHFPLHPPPNGYQSVTFFAHLLTVVQAGLPVHGKTKWFISSLHFYPIWTTSTQAFLKNITIATGLRCLSARALNTM